MPCVAIVTDRPARPAIGAKRSPAVTAEHRDHSITVIRRRNIDLSNMVCPRAQFVSPISDASWKRPADASTKRR